jgi:CBS domain-containing protein
LNENYKSTPKSFESVAEICRQNADKKLDMRPYMLSELYTVDRKDKFPKVLTIFRYLHLRHLCVVSKNNGKLEGIITR